MERLKLAILACLRVWRDVAFAGRVRELMENQGGENLAARLETVQAERDRLLAERGKEHQAGAQVLAIFQREGRLLDFLQESLENYSDAQIGAAVRNVHSGCRHALDQYFSLEPILARPEGEQVEIKQGFDPSAIRVIGDPVGEPPYRGVLKHHGWRLREGRLPALPEGQDSRVIQPAEVEV
jgi:hypothetical protein